MKTYVREKEAEWLSQAMDGDDQAFSRLVEAYQAPVYNLCYRMVGEAAEAEDAAQETFLKAYKALDRYDPDKKYINWILAIASNHCIDRLRKRRMKLVSIDEAVPIEDPYSPRPETALLARERQQAVQALLVKINPVDRAAVVLRYWHDMSYDEIAINLDVSVSAVKSRLHRARKQLALAWQESGTENAVIRGREHEASVV